MGLNILTLNCNGLLNPPTRSELFSLCRRFSIVLLQETHFYNSNNVLTFKSQFGSDKCYFSFGTNKSRGVGIVILNPHITVDKYFLDLDGRLVYVDIIFKMYITELLMYMCLTTKVIEIYFLTNYIQYMHYTKKYYFRR